MSNPIENNTCGFNSLPPVLVRYILEWVGDPVTRKVCKLLKDRFDQFCHSAWIRVENNNREPEAFRKRLTAIREDFESTYPELKGNGFKMIHTFLNGIIKNWELTTTFKERVKFNCPRELLYKAVGNESLLKFAREYRRACSIFDIWRYQARPKTVRMQPINEPSMIDWARKKAFEWLLKDYSWSNISSAEVKLDNLPAEIQHIKVNELKLEKHRLTELPQTFYKIENLTKIDLSNNCFTVFPKPLVHCKNLKTIDLSNNQIEELPKEICKLTKLRELFLSCNKIIKLPEGLCKLSKLHYFYISGNKLTEIPLGLCHLKNLTEIGLKHNNPIIQKRIMRIPTFFLPLEDFYFGQPHYYIGNKRQSERQFRKFEQNALEEALGLFFNLKGLKEEKAYWASSPLAKLYEAIICKNLESKDLITFVNALNEDQTLFYEMIFMCSVLFQESLSDDPVPIPKTLEEKIQWGKDEWLNVDQQVFDEAVAETIIMKYMNLDKNKRSEVEEQIRIQVKADNTNDPNQGKMLALSNLPRLADAMDPEHSSCVIN